MYGFERQVWAFALRHLTGDSRVETRLTRLLPAITVVRVSNVYSVSFLTAHV